MSGNAQFVSLGNQPWPVTGLLCIQHMSQWVEGSGACDLGHSFGFPSQALVFSWWKWAVCARYPSMGRFWILLCVPWLCSAAPNKSWAVPEELGWVCLQ